VLALGRTLVGPRSELGEAVQFHKCVVIGGGCRIGARAVLENCVLWDGVEVGAGARLKGCVLGNGARVGESAHLGGLVLGADALVPDYSRMHRPDNGD
jgi:mannose-1-phosphate guanylyltransferase